MTGAQDDDPHTRAQRERAAGAWALWIDQAPEDPSGWKALRRALRFSRADEPWLRERVPGPVRRGAREDLEPILGDLRAAGVEACLRRTSPVAQDGRE